MGEEEEGGGGGGGGGYANEALGVRRGFRGVAGIVSSLKWKKKKKKKKRIDVFSFRGLVSRKLNQNLQTATPENVARRCFDLICISFAYHLPSIPPALLPSCPPPLLLLHPPPTPTYGRFLRVFDIPSIPSIPSILRWAVGGGRGWEGDGLFFLLLNNAARGRR